MHVQVVTYRLTDGVSDDEFVAANQEFAEMMAAVPGLLAKVWLKNEGEGVYGGLYLWQNRDAFDNFMSGELWGAAVTDGSISDLVSRDFAVMDGLTRSTQPLLEMV